LIKILKVQWWVGLCPNYFELFPFQKGNIFRYIQAIYNTSNIY